MLTMPPRPPVATPEPTNRAPLFPLLAEPELNTSRPLTHRRARVRAPHRDHTAARRRALAALNAHRAARVHRAAPREQAQSTAHAARATAGRDGHHAAAATVAAPEPMISPPLFPPFDVPVLNTSIPLEPDAPEFALRITMLPLVDAVPSPLCTLSAPPVVTVLRPESTLTAPPEPLVPLPTLMLTMPPRPPVATPEPNDTEHRCCPRSRARAEHQPTAHARRTSVRSANRDHTAARRRALTALQAQRTATVHRAAARTARSPHHPIHARAAANADAHHATRGRPQPRPIQHTERRCFHPWPNPS